MDSLYNENHILGRLFRKFMDLFPQATKSTKKLLALFLIGQLCTEHFTSVRNLHKTFLSSACDKKLNSYYHALSNDKIANTQIRQIYHHGVLCSYGLESGLCSRKVVKCC